MQKYIFIFDFQTKMREILLYFTKQPFPIFGKGCALLFTWFLKRTAGNHFIHVCFESEYGASIDLRHNNKKSLFIFDIKTLYLSLYHIIMNYLFLAVLF